MSRIFLFDGHPAPESISRVIVDAYADAARDNGHEIRIQHLDEMEFDADHGTGGYRSVKPLEASLEQFLDSLAWANHIVLATPMWWGGLPAKTKGLFDRALLPGRAFDPRESVCGAPKPLLSGRSARVFITSDTPGWAMRLLYRNALFHQVRKQLFGFVGIRPTRISHLNAASHPTPEKVSQWRRTAARLGRSAR